MNRGRRGDGVFIGKQDYEGFIETLKNLRGHLIDSFAAGPIYSQRFTEVSVFSLLKDHLYQVIHLFPIAVVSLGLSVSVLTAPGLRYLDIFVKMLPWHVSKGSTIRARYTM